MAESMAAPAPQSLHIGAAFSFGWEKFKANLGPLALAAAVVLVINVVFSALSNGQAGLVAFVLGVLSYLVSQLIALGWIRISLKIVDGQAVSPGDLFQRADLLVPYVIASVLFGLMVGIGLVLLIVPGIILALIFGFFGYRIVDAETGPIDALQQSAAVTRGHRGELFGFWLLVIGLNLLGLLAVGLGLLITLPVSLLAVGYVYRELAAQPVPAA